MVFDVNMEIKRKAILVANAYRTKEPGGITYSSLLSREYVNIAMNHAVLNGMKIIEADIQNEYLTAPTT